MVKKSLGLRRHSQPALASETTIGHPCCAATSHNSHYVNFEASHQLNDINELAMHVSARYYTSHNM